MAGSTGLSERLTGFAYQLGWKLIWPSGTTWAFNGYILSYKPSGVTINSKIVATVKIKPTGPLTIPT